MTLEQLKQQKENSYLHAPDDGADWRCDECKQLFTHTKMILVWIALKHNPSEVNNPQWICLDCIDKDWLAGAKDCGMLE